VTASKGADAIGENDPGSGGTMTLPQGDLRLLKSDVAKHLLTSTIPARFAYIARDGTPRVVPTWFHWTGDELVMPTVLSAPHVRHAAARLGALRANPDVAITIDTEGFPPAVLLVRGRVSVTEVAGWCRSTRWRRVATWERKPLLPTSPRSISRGRGWHTSRYAPPGSGSSTSRRGCRVAWVA
jgi:hypothetical protein